MCVWVSVFVAYLSSMARSSLQFCVLSSFCIRGTQVNAMLWISGQQGKKEGFGWCTIHGTFLRVQVTKASTRVKQFVCCQPSKKTDTHLTVNMISICPLLTTCCPPPLLSWMVEKQRPVSPSHHPSSSRIEIKRERTMKTFSLLFVLPTSRLQSVGWLWIAA